MRRRPFAALLVSIVVSGMVAGLAACNALTGVGDLATGRTGEEGGTEPDTGMGSMGEGGLPFGDASDDGPPIDPNITVIPPSLTACGGTDSVCMTNTGGWTPALYLLFSITRTCPSNWPTPVTAKVSGGGGCNCTCTPSPKNACMGTIQGRTGVLSMCTTAAATVPVASDGTCSPVPEGGLPSPIEMSLIAMPPSTCASAVDAELGPPDDLTTCAGPTVTPSMVCAPTEQCVPHPPTMFGLPGGVLCMAHDGQAGCPQSLPMRIVTGTSISDGRSCGTKCGCTPSDCSGGTVDSFSDDTCTAALRTFDVDGKCNPTGAPTALSFKYTRASGCKVSQPAQEVGTETYQSPRTYCCQEPF